MCEKCEMTKNNIFICSHLYPDEETLHFVLCVCFCGVFYVKNI